MATRRAASTAPDSENHEHDGGRDRPVQSGCGELVRLERHLRIDRDDLDTCLIEQPDRYYHVAMACAVAVSDREAAKLDLEDLSAKLDKDIRARAASREEKITEAKIQQEIKSDSDYQEQRALLAQIDARIGALQALKEAFSQRSFMLRELVALTVSERSARAGATGSYEARGRTAQQAEEARSEALRGRVRSRGHG